MQALLLAALIAQQDTVRLNEITVTATRVPTPRAAISSAVTVLRADELLQRGARTIADALRLTPSAAVVQVGSLGAITSLFLRGGESDYVQVLIDGVRVNNPGGVYDFGNLLLDNIDRIEIVRGPVSVLYGSDAVTGVIQIFTRNQTRGVHARLAGTGGDKVGRSAAAAGRYATTSLSGALGNRHGTFSYDAGAASTSSDGIYAFNNRYQNRNLQLRAGVAAAAGWKLNWTARLTDSEFHYPTDGSGNLVDQNQYRTTESFTTGLDISRAFARLTLTARAGAHQNYERYFDMADGPADTAGIPASSSRGRVRRTFIDAGANYRLTNTVLTAGAEIEQQQDRNRYESGGLFPPSSSSRDRSNRGVYAQAIHTAGALALNAGLRGDFNDRFGDFITYRTGAALRIGAATRLRAAAGSAFKEPTFFENYAEGFTKGNPLLQPEHTQSLEAGIEHELSRMLGTLQVTYFRQRFKDLIQYVPTAFGSSEPNYRNVAAARADGLELEWSTRVKALRLDGTFTLLETEALDTEVEDPAFQPGQPLLRRPRKQGALTAAYGAGSAVIDGRVRYTGGRADLDFSGWPFKRVTLAPYTTFDLGVSWSLRAVRPLRLSARLENLTDERYEEALNFPARGRTLQLAVDTRLGW